MVALFMIDEDLVDYFINAYILKYLQQMMKVGKPYNKGEGSEKQSSILGSKNSIFSVPNIKNYAQDHSYIMNIIIIVINLFEYKSYAFTKQLKIDYLAFLLTHYS